MNSLRTEGPVPVRPNKGKWTSLPHDFREAFQQSASVSKDMSGDKRIDETNEPETQPWEPTPLPLLERNTLMAHPDRLVVCEI